MHNAPFSPAADRNKQPILDVLRQVLPPSGSMLELASGTGQHAAWMSAGLPDWTWQPTEVNDAALPGIAAWLANAATHNARTPCLLDVADAQWPADDETLGSAFAQPFDAMFCANLLHISPWSTCTGLMQGAARHLAPHGLLVLYGPYFEDDVSPSPGNLAFNQSLRAQNTAWGVRRREAVEEEAQRAGLVLRERHAMPANNLLLVFARTPNPEATAARP